MATKKESPAQAEIATSATATKRKSSIQEIEVDLSAPEPPSKRARRALKKGKTLAKRPVSEDEDEDDEDEVNVNGEKGGKKDKDTARSEHGIWVGNLPFSATAASLRKWLVDHSGEAIADESITRIKLPTVKEPGRDRSRPPANRGFAYVDFADLGPKVAAIALSETDMGGRKLLIKDAASFEGRPKKEKAPAEADGVADGRAAGTRKQDAPPASRKVFVGNLGFKTTEDDLRRQFEKCGEMEWVKLATFEDTGKCKGYGWVKFRDAEAAAWAVKGFVKIREKVETEDDFAADDDDAATSDAESPRQQQFRTRKWWVNRLLGRQLKLELAEDDQTRYKKRFGRAAPREPRAAAARPTQPPDEPTDLVVARLTGAVVKHTGSKVTFD